MASYFLFPTTNSVFLAEEVLNESDIICEIKPTPVSDKICCGLCIAVNKECVLRVIKIFKENHIEFLEII